MLLAAALITALGFWTYGAVERSLRELRAATLTSLLQAEVRALEIWVQNHKVEIRRVARDAQVRMQVEALAKIASRPGGSSTDYCESPARRPLVQNLTAALEEAGAVAFNAVDASRRIIASRFREYCGLRISSPAFNAEIAPVFRGETRFLRPNRDIDRLDAVPAKLPIDRPLVWIETPVIAASGDIIAALGFGEYADGAFAAILSAARTGDTGEAYAFDRRGALLSPARFAERGLTPLGARAREEPEGVALDPYASYYGGRVIGAWRWLPDYDMGIAVELGAEEAYAPMRYLNIAFGIVFTALVLATLAALASGIGLMRLRRRIVGDGRRLGTYVLDRPIGEGGVATVYLARHNLLKRPTAVKLLKPARASDEMIARFEREVQLASSLSHPNTVEIFDYGRTRDGLFFYAMEYLDGLTVAEIVARERALGVARSAHLLRQVCAALAEAHGKGLVHRDIKPENIMVCRHGGEFDFVKLLDFGLVKQMSGQHTRNLTRTLNILGTPLYMAPERLRNPADVDARADIYAVGAVAFHMLTGRRLFESSDDLELTSKILNDVPPRASTLAPEPLPPRLDELIARCVAKNRDERPQTIGELLEAFERFSLEHRWTQAEAAAWWGKITPAQP